MIKWKKSLKVEHGGMEYKIKTKKESKKINLGSPISDCCDPEIEHGTG